MLSLSDDLANKEPDFPAPLSATLVQYSSSAGRASGGGLGDEPVAYPSPYDMVESEDGSESDS